MPDQTVIFAEAIATMSAETNAYGLVPQGAVAISDGVVDWVGARSDLPDRYRTFDAEDVGARLITPGLIDAHTHIVFGGNRAAEFELRLNGASYTDIAQSGGGILSTVRSTRALSLSELVSQSLPRVDALLREGVCTIEVKSGYGLDQETELNMLRAARILANLRDIRVKTTFLGAHALPPDFSGREIAFINEIVLPTLRIAHAEGLVDAVDGFCETIAFAPEHIAVVFDEAKALGLPVKLHAEQLSNLGGAKLAASYNALSADHLEYLDPEGAIALARAGSCAVLLPGAYYTLRETTMPPVEDLRRHNVPMVLATDCNPGSSPMTSLLLALNMGCTLFRMTPSEALHAVTRNAAKALGLKDVGTIAPGMRADLAIWDVRHPAELSYRIGFNPLYKRVFGGIA